MLSRLLQFSLKQRWLILLIVLALAILGIYNFTRLPIDAVPDITNVQVQINTAAPGFTPYEVEQRITFPVEAAMSGLPDLDYTRSLSRYGLSQVTVVFKDGTDIYFARQLINERLQEVRSKLPANTDPTMGPISTGLGEIFMYTVTAEPNARDSENKPYTPMSLRTIQDWLIKLQLRTIPGVADVNGLGGYTKQYQVMPDPKKLLRYNLSLDDIVHALEKNNKNVGAGYIESNGEQYLIRVPGQVNFIPDIERIVVSSHNGVSIRIGDVATTSIGGELRTGAATTNSQETVIGTVFMLMGANSRTVAHDVAAKLKEINKSLPKGVNAIPVYDRTTLVNATIKTVSKNLFEGALLVCIVLFLFLGNIRAALITAAMIPLAMLFTITGMVHQKISANLMSLGALDFGLIVDGGVIIVENCIKKLSDERHKLKRALSLDEHLSLTFSATQEVIKPSVFGIFIITIVYLPILTLTGVEGKMFLPMAQTVILALLSAMILSLTFVPAAIAIFLRKYCNEKENVIMQSITNAYAPLLHLCFKHRKQVMISAALLVMISVGLFFSMGTEFVPNLDEGDIALHAIRIPGTSLSQAIDMQYLVEKKLKQFPEVSDVFSKLGTAEIATDPMPPNVADTYVILKPRKLWPNPDQSKDKLISAMEEALSQLPGNNYEFAQPIQMRFNELISGVRSDVAIKVFGDNMNQLLKVAQHISAEVSKIPGAADVKVEQASGLPLITVEIDRNALARYGLQITDVQNALSVSLSSQKTGEIFEGDKRFDIVIRVNEALRTDPDILHKIFIPLPPAEDNMPHFIPLSEVSTIKVSEGPNQISRENGKRRVVVTANIRGRDLGSFITESKEKIKETIVVPSGYWIDWSGQFEQLQTASKRLSIVIPITLALIFILLFMSLGNITDTILVATGLPLALTGGVLALWIRHIPLSISAGIGFIALSGVAVLNGLVMISFIKNLRKNRIPIRKAVLQGSLSRLRPVLITALVASLGFIPMAIATGTGAEVQRPLATVVIGGILSSTFLTLLVLPGLYFSVHIWQRQWRSYLRNSIKMGKSS
jgi:cobalt-zinc-cadmium resistance protein CzcA